MPEVEVAPHHLAPLPDAMLGARFASKIYETCLHVSNIRQIWNSVKWTGLKTNCNGRPRVYLSHVCHGYRDKGPGKEGPLFKGGGEGLAAFAGPVYLINLCFRFYLLKARSR